MGQISRESVLNQLRREILAAAYMAKEGHIASAYSILDIVYEFYYHHRQAGLTRLDRFVLSKGHASLALYSVLSHFGYQDKSWIDTFAQSGSIFGGHPDSTKLRNVELSTGSLGHGLPIAIGMSLAKKIKGESGRIFVLVGDGEMNEGSNWESLLLARKFKLNNLVLIIDLNNSGDRAVKIENFQSKLKAFDMHCLEIDGHNAIELAYAFSAPHEDKNEMVAIIAHTIKGKGIPEMEGNPAWHHGAPNSTDYSRFMEYLT